MIFHTLDVVLIILTTISATIGILFTINNLYLPLKKYNYYVVEYDTFDTFKILKSFKTIEEANKWLNENNKQLNKKLNIIFKIK